VSLQTSSVRSYVSALREDEHEERLGERAADYRGYASWHRAWADLEESGAEARLLGRSVQGRPIFGFEWGDRSAGEISVLLSGVHAMEWIGLEVGHSVVRGLRERFPNRRTLYIPLLNPDGFRRAEMDLVEGRRRFVRANAHGVDLNRGWPTHYRRFHGPSKIFSVLGNSGSGPRAEPEIDAVCAELDRLVNSGVRVERALSLHSFGEVILRPWGGVFARTKDEPALRAASQAIADKSAAGYRPKQVSRWYPGISFAHGMEIDHLYGAYGAQSLLVECSTGGFRWSDRSSWFHPWRWFNPPDPDACAEDLRDPLVEFLAGVLPSSSP
jgi:hypothetical protein